MSRRISASSFSPTETSRSLGYEPFSAESDSLLTRSDVPAATSTTQSPPERQQALPKDSFGFVIIFLCSEVKPKYFQS